MDKKRTKIILADDHQIFLDGLTYIVETMHLELLGTAKTGEEVFEIIKNKGIPDILVLDIEMPGGMDGITAAGRLKEKYPSARILILSMHKEKEFVLQILKIGVEGYVLKDSGQHEFKIALETIIAGQQYVDAKLSGLLMGAVIDEKSPHALLSPREIEIIRLIADQKTTSQIAEKLFLSKYTVETHRKNILFKLELNNSAGLIKYAFQNGLIK